ncbi:MAG: RagB/SusD family nutrient uptake outer membrane protein, partial [Dysgonamonadaceae bacterium]|nr:RagB/SusD family nutrient uptake outer membrane protein [Dysgonamonadaceae bacterium]
IRRQEWIGEATFIKAMIYFELMLTWGPVPIVPDEPQDFDTPIEQLMIERSTWDECSAKVEELLKRAIELLPETRLDMSETGKATKNAARAVLSRLTLYTASPLYNGQNHEFIAWKNNAGTPYLNPAFDPEKWAKAAAAAKELVTLKPNDLYTVAKKDNTPDVPVPDGEQGAFPNGVGGIDHFHSYKDMFDGECVQASTNAELIFTKQNSDVNEFTRYMDPGMLDGWSGFFFPQRIVDQYYMADGRDINNSSSVCPYESTGYTATDSTWSGDRMSDGFTLLAGTRKWYANREMRFYATVAFNNSFYPSTSTRPDLVGADGKAALFFANSVSGKEAAAQRPSAQGEEYPMTGYLGRKFTHYEDSWLTGGRRKKKYGIQYRMAEVYLNYVEAMNELDKTYTVGDVSVSRDETEMRRCFNLIRYRAGLPGITAADVSNKQRMRELIERERLIEMMWEGRRYFDVRRNKTAMRYENEPIMGLNVSARTSAPESFYSIVRTTERNWLFKVFTPKMTFWPIPKHEIDKNYNLDQMPGY